MKRNAFMKNILLASPLLLAAACSSNAVSPSAATTIVEVTGGSIEGYVDDGVRIFKGIPFAASTAGKNRFRDPQPVEPWSGVKDCRQFGQIVVQNEQHPFECWTAEYVDGGLTMQNGRMGEDSLNLNVWTTAREGDKRPVIVYIHGGANDHGSGQNEVYDGRNIAKKGVVYLTINYRVGLYGFLAYRDKTGAEVRGNFAIKDQISALKWVQDNIAAFGGDPDNVTIAGQSAGSLNVQTLIASPAARGLFKRAVAMSANGYGFGAASGVKSVEEAMNEAAEALGNDITVEELRAMSIEDLEAIRARYNPRSAVNDGGIAPDLKSAYLSGNFNHVDLMQGAVTGDAEPILFGGFIDLPDDDNNAQTPVRSVTPVAFENAVRRQLGSLADEFFAAYPMDANSSNVISVSQAASFDNMAAQYSVTLRAKNSHDGEHKSYQYMFTRSVPDKDPDAEARWGAFHTGDVGYWLDYFSPTSERPWTNDDYALGDRMSDYLVNFAATGNPNGAGLPEWKAVDDGIQYMQLDVESAYRTFNAAKAKFWADYYASELSRF